MRRALETLLPLACVSAIASGCAVTRADRNLVITDVFERPPSTDVLNAAIEANL